MEVARYACANCSSTRPHQEERCGACGARACVYFAGLDTAADTRAAAADELSRARVRMIPTGIAGVDEALAGGIVLGSTLLLYGPGGSRKTTIAGACAHAIGLATGRLALYVSSEQPSARARDAAERIVGRARGVLWLGTERGSSDFARVRAEVERLSPSLVVYDSIQEFSAPLGAVVGWGKRAAEAMGHAAIFVSTVNAAGRPEGPRRTIHRADTELELAPEGASVRVRKSRYVPTATVALDWSTPPAPPAPPAPSSRAGGDKPSSVRARPKTSRK